MLFNTAKTFLSRYALGVAIKTPVVPAVSRLPALKLSQVRYNSSATREYTVRDALNEALGMSYYFLIRAQVMSDTDCNGVTQRRNWS
jgi:hypothetical protein